MIEGVKVKPLKAHPDERGHLMEVLRSDDPEMFMRFGQAYVTTGYPGVVKAWHYHRVQYDHFCVVSGEMKVVLYDPRPGSGTTFEVNEFFMGAHSPILLRIPPMVFHGFKTVGEREAILLNCTTEPYDPRNPDEHRVAPHGGQYLPEGAEDLPMNWINIPYDWGRRDG